MSKNIKKLLDRLKIHLVSGTQIAEDFNSGFDVSHLQFVLIDNIQWEADNVINMIEAEKARIKIQNGEDK